MAKKPMPKKNPRDEVKVRIAALAPNGRPGSKAAKLHSRAVAASKKKE